MALALETIRWPILAGALLLSACADYFVVEREPGTPVWSGTTTAGTAVADAECRPVRMSLFFEDDVAYPQVSVEGRAQPVDGSPPGLADRYLSTWWISGQIYPNGTTLFSLRRQTPVVDGPRFSSQWRGTLEGDRIVAEEGPTGCGRTVVVERQG